ncbi:MAG: spheroidene monooxygenase [Cyclobacteriaceae bacterium]|nr:spheroidene monooxygenase [Cyclobacteriaceae bacterium]
MSGSISTLTFFRFQGFSNKVWAFSQMQFAHSHFARIPGLLFYKLMGSGREIGFNPLPDWGVYAFLAVWENEAAANQFFTNAEIFRRYKAHTSEQWTIFMKTSRSKGLWSGANPFTSSTDLDEGNPLIAVITRATIRTSKLVKFWRFVPTSQRPIRQGCDGLIYTKGIGEAPLVQMATFSLWKDTEALQSYAYKSPEHLKAIQKTRQLNWYKEEMFVRFQPYKSVGTWNGVSLLDAYLKP